MLVLIFGIIVTAMSIIGYNFAMREIHFGYLTLAPYIVIILAILLFIIKGVL